MKKTRILLALFAAATVLSACVPTEETTVNIGPDFSEIEGDYELEFTQLHNDTLEGFDGDNPYAFIEEVDITGDNAKKKISVTAVSVEEATKEDADRFMAALLRHLNDAACVQDRRFTVSSQKNFGTLTSVYGVSAKVVTESGAEVASYEIAPGDPIALDPDIETYLEEWQKTMEIYKRNNKK